MKLDMFFPWKFVNSAYTIPYRLLYRAGYRGLIFDIDNTLTEHGAPADEKVRRLFRDLKEIGFTTCLVSNNRKERVKKLADEVGSQYTWKACKPLPSACRKAMGMMGTKPSRTLLVGDQLFTDIWCANWAGIRSILVRPINPREEIQIVLKRRLEAPFLRAYVRKGLLRKKETGKKRLKKTG
ncbi:MAG: YqeG family HAD IIIA-type phosphatase [Clostridium sp.]|nr:YqeG family HAD IIIA-type phosphatase [Clostridium sp.]